jgi:RimJ/RimL family protein N-acetyltransferase
MPAPRTLFWSRSACLTGSVTDDWDLGPETTGRLSFRRWVAADAEAVLDMYGREDVYRFLGSSPSPVRDRDEAEARIARWSARSAPGRGLWAVTLGDDGSDGCPIGTVLLMPLPRSDGQPSDALEIGWHFHPAVWGNGYATEAAQAVIHLAGRLGLPEVTAVVFAGNAASLRVCERLGMTGRGPTTQWYGVEMLEFVLAL